MQRQDNKNILILKGEHIAHRGYHNKQFPENSIGAFKRAVENNFHIEMDLHLSKDKQLIVFHDDDMQRVTGISGRIEDYDSSFLKTVKILNTEETIPTFDDLLQVVDGKVGLVIELKTCKENNKLLCQKLVDRLKSYTGPFVVQSFDPIMMKEIRKLNPDIIRGQLVCSFKGEKISWYKKILLKNMWTNILSKPDFINTEQNFYSNKIKHFHKHHPVICWTIRSKQEKERAKKFDNIIFERFDPRG